MSKPTPLSLDSTLPLPNSTIKIPRLGFGVWESHGDDCVSAVIHALQSGYRHIDTAQYYGNEALVRTAVLSSNIPRSEIFITTKYDEVKDGERIYQDVLDSVRKIDGEDGYVDLFLVHSADIGARHRKLVWEALERALEEGKASAIGVSNYGIGNIEEMKAYAKIWPPMVNQIEVCHVVVLDCFFSDKGSPEAQMTKFQ